MWQLHTKAPADQEWVAVGSFETVTAAARRIRELEHYATTGVFLDLLVETKLGTDDEAFSVPHHTGRNALYGIRRRRN